MTDVVRLQAPAKLNLALSVGPPEDDGLHPICSWMQTVTLFDDLEVRRLPEDYFSRYAILWHEEAPRRSEIDWSITSDLAVRAHLALEDLVDRKLPVQLKLEKRIPVGGGLGGGSSDAAAMLRAVNALYDLGLSEDELRGVGAGLGSDVPFLIRGGAATVEGRGDAIEPHDEAPQVYAALVFPDAACPTGDVYRGYDELGGTTLNPDLVHALRVRSNGVVRPDGLFNDLTDAAIETAPAIGAALKDVSALAERPAALSGSGASLFVLCDDELHATHLAAAIVERLDLPAVAATSIGQTPIHHDAQT